MLTPHSLAIGVGFASPWFLCLLALIPLTLWMGLRHESALSRPRRAACLAVRSVVLLAAILALAELRILKKLDRLAVFFVLDRSESIPAEQREAARQYVLEAAATRDPSRSDLVGVIAFGKTAGIEVAPREAELELDSFVTLVEPEATSLAAAVRLAAAAFPEGVGRRMVIFSDGNENRDSVLEEARVARSLGIAIDVVPITYSYPSEISVEKLLVDAEVHVGQPFDVRVVVESTRDAEAYLRLFENDVLVPQGDPRVKLQSGKNVLDFKGRRLELAGRYYYEARLEPVDPADDSILQNNTAFGLTVIEGEPKVLFCASEPELDGALLEALEAEKIAVKRVLPDYLPRSAEQYLDYEAIILSNVAAHQLSEDQMKLFEGLVKTLGLGFIMMGGENSFGAGGYQGTAVERLLPVEMEIKQRKVLPNGALAMVIHSCELGNGNAWAIKVIQQALRILSPRDYAGVLYYGMQGERWLFPMTPVSQRQMMLSRLDSFNPGDMPSFEPIMKLALQGLQSTPASIKHMVVLSDGDPTPPSDPVIAAIRAARVTISTICYGAHGSIPPAFKLLAQQGGGKFYYLQSASNLPEIFIREAATVQRSLISEESFIPILASAGPILQGIEPEELPPLDGYVITTPKELASQLLLHPPGKEDPAKDPVLAVWTYGLGKSVAFTSDAGRRWGKKWVAWKAYQRFWGQCVRWVSRARTDDRFRFTRNVDGDRGAVSVDALAPDGQLLNGLRFEGHVISPGHETQPVSVRQVGPGRYDAEFPVSRRGTYTMVLSYEKDGRPMTCVTSLSIPYSPEYRRLQTHHDLLMRLAAAGGGRYLEDPARALDEGAFFSRDFPVSSEVTDVWRQLLVLGTALFFLDVFIRRVVVNYAQVALAFLGAALRVVTRRKASVAPEDARLATLLERKARLRETVAARYAPAPGAGAEEKPVAAGARAAAASEVAKAEEAAAAAGAGKAAEGGVGGEPQELSPARGESFTARLLEAKRRALKRDEKKT